MAIDINSLATRGWTRAVAAATNVTSGAACRIMGIMVTAATDAASVKVVNALTDTGTDFFLVKAPIQTTTYVSFAPQGTRFGTGLTIAETGTTPDIAVLYIIE